MKERKIGKKLHLPVSVATQTTTTCTRPSQAKKVLLCSNSVNLYPGLNLQQNNNAK
jgi:hypothetical protein